MAHAYLAFQDVERGALALRGPPKSWREGGRAATLIRPLPSRTDYPPGTPSKPRQKTPGGTVACSRSCAASIADAGALAVSCRTERTGASRRQPRCRAAALTRRGLGKRPRSRRSAPRRCSSRALPSGESLSLLSPRAAFSSAWSCQSEGAPKSEGAAQDTVPLGVCRVAPRPPRRPRRRPRWRNCM